jgi:YbgC/YbaW family acyl-CoA thioester hydrolase
MVKKTVRMSDTDATGQIYFINLQKMAVEVFEEFLCSSGCSLAKIMTEEAFLFPIVRVEADYLAPVQICDVLEIERSLSRIGTASFTMQYSFYKDLSRLLVARVIITHVMIDKTTRQSLTIPKTFIEILNLK